jgi:hypothetical protein
MGLLALVENLLLTPLREVDQRGLDCCDRRVTRLRRALLRRI